MAEEGGGGSGVVWEGGRVVERTKVRGGRGNLERTTGRASVVCCKRVVDEEEGEDQEEFKKEEREREEKGRRGMVVDESEPPPSLPSFHLALHHAEHHSPNPCFYAWCLSRQSEKSESNWTKGGVRFLERPGGRV